MSDKKIREKKHRPPKFNAFARPIESFANRDEKQMKEHFVQIFKLLRDEESYDRNRFHETVLNKKPEERQRGGRALLHLSLFDQHFNVSGQKLLSFGFSQKKYLPRYTFQVGDVVTLNPGQTPSKETPVGTVYEIDRKAITIAFNQNLPSWVAHENTYHLFQAQNLTTFPRMFEMIKRVSLAENNRLAHFRDLSFGLRPPQVRDAVKRDKFQFINQQLNELQQQAVLKALECDDILLIHGPPGTGKTSVLIEIMAQAKKAGESVLASCPSNAACDYLVESLAAKNIPVMRLGHPARITPALHEHTLNYKLAKHPYAKLIDQHQARLEQLGRQKERRQERRVMNWEEKREMRDETRTLRDDIRLLKTQIYQQVWNEADIVVTTHISAGDPFIQSRTFDWVILDEATQAIEPASWIPISRGHRIVMAGDHHQLPPTVLSAPSGPRSLKYTLFERLHETLGEESKIKLQVQYRMHESIMKFSSSEFYEGELQAAPSVHKHTLEELLKCEVPANLNAPLIYLDTAGLGYEEAIEEGTGSRFNEGEAKLVIQEMNRLIKAGVQPEQIAIISPYSAQVKLLSSLILPDQESAVPQSCPEINSIDAFQGREAEVVIISLVRSNLVGQIGFLGDVRRMNVGMTRARRKLLIIGDSATISTLPFYEDFIKYAESIQGYQSAWELV